MKILLFLLLPVFLFGQATAVLDCVQVYLHHNTGFTLSAAGDSVTTWADQSGKGNDAGPDVAARKPLYLDGGIIVTEVNDAGFTWGSRLLPTDALIWGFSFWFKDYSGTSSDFVVGGESNRNIFFRGAAAFVGFRDDGSTYNNSTITTASITNVSTYKHIVITSGGNDVLFYLDGVLQDQINPTAATKVRVDAWPQGYSIQTTNSLNGTFTEFICTSDSITPLEVTRLYNLGYDGISDGKGFNKRWLKFRGWKK